MMEADECFTVCNMGECYEMCGDCLDEHGDCPDNCAEDCGACALCHTEEADVESGDKILAVTEKSGEGSDDEGPCDDACGNGMCEDCAVCAVCGDLGEDCPEDCEDPTHEDIAECESCAGDCRDCMIEHDPCFDACHEGLCYVMCSGCVEGGEGFCADECQDMCEDCADCHG